MGRKPDKEAVELVEQALIELKKPVSFSKIKIFLKGTGLTEKRIKKALDYLLAEKRLIVKDAKYLIQREEVLLKGVFDESRRGFGFVIHADGDIFIPARLKGGAMDGDIVEVAVTGKKRGKREGRITRVIERKFMKIYGVCERKGKYCILVPSDKRIRRDVLLLECTPDAEGKVVEAEIERYPATPDEPLFARLTRVIGSEDEPGVDMEVLLRMHGLPLDFPEEVKEEATRIAFIPEKEVKRRVDLRDLFTVTIDGLDAKDFDDAVSCSREGRNFRLWVHIADVSFYVKPGSHLDNEAKERAFSCYLVDRVIPMLPFELSAGICSLKPEEDRLSVTVEMLIDENGEVIQSKAYESIIRSDHRLTYEEIDESIRTNKFKSKDVKKLVDELLELREVLEKKRLKRGALNFEIPEAKVILDEKGIPVDVIVRQRTLATSIIEEAMIVTNETLARMLMENEIPAIYRVHEKPDENDLLFAQNFLAELGYLEARDLKPTPKSFQKIIRASEKRTDKILVNILLLRAMKKARYSSQPLGHFGLASQSYLHFTSPIRRYPDLIVHRQLKRLLNKEKFFEKEIEALESVATHCSAKEIEVETAERDSQELKLYQLMKERYLGEVFEGIISGVTSQGFFVELENTAEGFVNVSEMYDDYYITIPEKFEIVGKKTGKVFRVGEKIMVQVISVNVAERFMKLKVI